MPRLKLFTMALYAMRPDPELTVVTETEDGRISYVRREREGEVQFSNDIGIAPYWELCATEDEARAAGLEVARAMWPPAEGWHAHTVALASHDLRAAMIEAFGPELDLPYGAPAEDEPDEVAAELIM